MNSPGGLEATHLKELLLDNRYFIYLFNLFLEDKRPRTYGLPDMGFALFNSQVSGKQSLIIYY